ncbi:7074_t:CDS:2, partial [Ambispora leptoticha]
MLRRNNPGTFIDGRRNFKDDMKNHIDTKAKRDQEGNKNPNAITLRVESNQEHECSENMNAQSYQD